MRNKTEIRRRGQAKKTAYNFLKECYEEYKQELGEKNIKAEKMIANYNKYRAIDFEKMERELDESY